MGPPLPVPASIMPRAVLLRGGFRLSSERCTLNLRSLLPMTRILLELSVGGFRGKANAVQFLSYVEVERSADVLWIGGLAPNTPKRIRFDRIRIEADTKHLFGKTRIRIQLSPFL